MSKSIPASMVFLFSIAVVGIHYSFAQTTSQYDELIQQGNTQLKAGNADRALSTGQSAIKISSDQWQGYALVGGALMNLKRYEEATDALSKAIERAPEAKQPALRDLRRQCLQAQTNPAMAATSAPTMAEVVLWKTIENSTNLADFRAYLNQYPQGAFATLAQSRLTEANDAANNMRSVLNQFLGDWNAKGQDRHNMGGCDESLVYEDNINFASIPNDDQHITIRLKLDSKWVHNDDSKPCRQQNNTTPYPTSTETDTVSCKSELTNPDQRKYTCGYVRSSCLSVPDVIPNAVVPTPPQHVSCGCTVWIDSSDRLGWTCEGGPPHMFNRMR